MASEISMLMLQLNDPAAGVRARAAEELARLGEEARGAAVPLVRAAGDRHEEVREWATAALEELGPPAPADLASLAELLASEEADVVYWAATLLGRLQFEAAPAAPALCAALHAQRPHNVRERAAWALGKIGRPAGDAAATALEQAAADSQPRLSRLAQQALEQFRG
jgi:HEAT repeat protein